RLLTTAVSRLARTRLRWSGRCLGFRPSSGGFRRCLEQTFSRNSRGGFASAFRNEFSNPREQIINCISRRRIVRPAGVQEFLQNVRRPKTKVGNLRIGRQKTIANLPDQVFYAMRNRRYSVQPDLRC